MNCSFSVRTTLFLPALLLLISAWGADAQKADSDAARLNSVGVALMNQQIPGKALAKFEDAHRADPSSAIPLLNKGIALIYLRRLPEAEQALTAASVKAPADPRSLVQPWSRSFRFRRSGICSQGVSACG